MNLSKRPKGPEIEEWVTRGWKYHKDLEWSHHPQLLEAIGALRRDVNLLMAYLKLEFKDIESVPKKRVVGKATKKKAPEGMTGYGVALADVLKAAAAAQTQANVLSSKYPWTACR